MGILRVLNGSDEEPPGFDSAAVPTAPGRQSIEYDGAVYDCMIVTSPDGRWTLAYGRRRNASESWAARLRENRVVDNWSTDRPTAGAIANDGSATIVESQEANSTVTRLRAFDAEGREQLTEPFDATLRRPAISADGTLVGVITRPPTVAVETFSIADRRREGRHTLAGRRGRLLGFHQRASGPILYVATRSEDIPYVGLSARCEVEWKSAPYRMSQSLADRVRGWISAVRS
ncbi:hypothetical protein [Halalkalirubrum salinum]|uniref:hypothetical protein n=1 Tax=Halalkalirubrum salinum TaxID=2563889 RepID=UPI0010FBA60C|nr:hypothetical protein [Halalkalirubrum salinum]